MAELWGDDDYLYGAYLRSKGRMPCGLKLLVVLAGILVVVGVVGYLMG